ncbi:hypothetical protein BGV72_24415 [Burkholderia ubonensis]|uniref:hypothetical protein n=1 Tax=Burkholderia ubonensis TaxID=101571 RepID=UPI0008FE10C6|nr:hypothetical protein [Burkholderia ubonensis]OJA74501.1 hypothetical protein BGV72_24415 [Burkholderia ubonensis]
MTDKKIYVYQSPFGQLSIRPDSDQPDTWYFVYEDFTHGSNGELLSSKCMIERSWQTAESCAESVRTQSTGWHFWDTLPFVVFPTSLEDWIPVDPYAITSAKA